MSRVCTDTRTETVHCGPYHVAPGAVAMSATLVSGRLKPTIRSVRQAAEARERYAPITIEDSMMPTLVRAVAIPAHVWVTVPGTQVQVRHDAGHTSWCRVDKDGSLTFGNTDVAWETRPALW
jgi:hypothetical protein